MSSNATKAGIGYLIANLLIRGISFITLPIFSRILDTYDFGLYNVFIAYDSILFCIIGFALHSSVKSANWEFPGKIDEYISSLTILYIFNAIIFTLMSLLFCPILEETIGFGLVVLIALVLHSFGSAIVALYNAKVSLQYSYVKYMIVAAISSLGNIALSLLLIFTIFNNQRYLGRIVGSTAALFIMGLAILVLFWYGARPTVSIRYWKFGIRYSLPIVAHGLSQVVLGQFGRLIVNYMVSPVAAGIYGLAANFLTIVAVLIDSVSTVWSTWFYETMEGEKANEATQTKSLSIEETKRRGAVVRVRANQIATLFAAVAIALMAVTPEMVWLLGGDAYMEGAYCAFGMIMSGFCVSLYNLIVVGEYYKQRTNYIMVGTMASAAICVVLTFWAIQVYGYIAAAYTTLAAYVFYVAFHWIICKRLIGFSILGIRRVGILSALLGFSFAIDLFLYANPILRCLLGLITTSAIVISIAREVGGLRYVLALVKK